MRGRAAPVVDPRSGTRLQAWSTHAGFVRSEHAPATGHFTEPQSSAAFARSKSFLLTSGAPQGSTQHSGSGTQSSAVTQDVSSGRGDPAA